MGGLFFYQRPSFESGSIETNSGKESSFPYQDSSNAKTQESVYAQEKFVFTQPSIHLAPADRKKWDTFQEILKSKNDNDPRVDQILFNLSESFKLALRDYYQNLPMEKRNERGFIAFLVSRQLSSENDVSFLKSILNEKPCLSMSDCNTQGFQDPHHASTDNVSLNYPQLVVLYEIENKLKLESSLSSIQRQWLRDIIQSGINFPAGIVSSRAHEAMQKF